jgi:hypothetical protein
MSCFANDTGLSVESLKKQTAVRCINNLFKLACKSFVTLGDE